MKSAELLSKAARAIKSARLLLNAGDVDGACDRAYYAMFDAARARLIEHAAPVTPESIKTHSGLIAMYSLHLVKPGVVSSEFGKSLNKVAEMRLIADYTEDEIAPDRAAWAIEQAAVFVEVMRSSRK